MKKYYIALLALTAAFAFSTAAFAGSLPGSLWYNGDLNHVNGLANERDSGLGFGQFAHVWDNFVVTDSAGWNITGAYSNNYTDYNSSVTGVEWEIRQGVSAGNGGTVVAGGTENINFAVTFHDPGDFGFVEYTVSVFGISVNLAPGTYWLNVTPIGQGSGRSFTSDTSGANCIGTPCGNDGNAFFDSNFFGANFQSTADQGQPGDFSMGVVGTVVPEPATWALLTCGVGALLAVRRRRAS